MDRLEEAERLYRSSLEIEEKLHGSDDVRVALLQYGLALVLDAQGRPDAAKPLYDASYWPLLQKLEFDDPILGMIACKRADLEFKQGRYSDAEQGYQSSLKIAEHVPGPESPIVGIRLYKLANARHELDRNVEAEPLARRSLEILEKTRGPAHPDTADARAILVKILQTQGRNEEAERLSNTTH
jgi:tetratricopeptide (TPR) repeat protein